MADVTGVPDGMRRFAGAWWVVLLVGIACVAAGVIVLAEPAISLATLAVITGIFLLVDGIFEILSSLGTAVENRGLLALLGVLSVIIGIILVRHPIAGVVAVALLLGLWLVAFGIVRLVAAFDRPEHPIWNLVLAVLEVIAGIIVVSSPDIGVGTLAIIVGITFVLRGLGMCVAAWALRALGSAAGSGGRPRPA